MSRQSGVEKCDYKLISVGVTQELKLKFYDVILSYSVAYGNKCM